METSPEERLTAWIGYLRDMGVYDLYQRQSPTVVLTASMRAHLLSVSKSRQPSSTVSTRQPLSSLPMSDPQALGATTSPPTALTQPQVPAARPSRPAAPGRTYFSTEAGTLQAFPPELAVPMPKPDPLENLAPPPARPLPPDQRQAALDRLQAEIGDCTRCPLAYAGRHTVVFGEGDPRARLMFVGEGPGADEDASGRPFVGKAGQLLNNMISAMGLQREEVYIANIVKCRPPGNRAPEFEEATTCSQFLLGQIDIVRPAVIVALGATAATYVLGVRQSLASLRGQWLACRGSKVAVTYHPAFLLRDPRQKAEAWKDLQRVMLELQLAPLAPRKA